MSWTNLDYSDVSDAEIKSVWYSITPTEAINYLLYINKVIDKERPRNAFPDRWNDVIQRDTELNSLKSSILHSRPNSTTIAYFVGNLPSDSRRPTTVANSHYSDSLIYATHDRIGCSSATKIIHDVSSTSLTKPFQGFERVVRIVDEGFNPKDEC
jgi:hypothetical protein